ncbi:hypothetical protein Bca101_008854 [Brassica carinata]
MHCLERWERMIAPNDCTYNILIQAHLRDGDLAASAKLIEEMKRCGFSADASTVKMVMDMLSDGQCGFSGLALNYNIGVAMGKVSWLRKGFGNFQDIKHD